MKAVRVMTGGKINLSLNILGRENGMHLIDSVMQSVSFGDFVSAAPRTDNKINVSFVGEGAHLIDGKNNSVTKTVSFLKAKFGDFGADILVEKGLPLAGGLGGSSADAAAVLVALSSVFQFDKRGLDLNSAAAALSSDLSFMLCGGCARVGGKGEKILGLTNNLPLYMVIAHLGDQISSQNAYARFDSLYPSFAFAPADTDKLVDLLYKGDKNALKLFANALEPASQSLCGNITLIKTALMDAGAETAVMTGSGGCCAGFFEDMAAAQAAEKHLKNKGLWAKSCFSTNVGTSIV